MTRATRDYRSLVSDQIDGINDSARLCRSISLTLLLFTLVSIAMGVSADDEILLREDPIILPPFNLGVPVVGFFAAAPVAIAILHFHFVLKLRTLYRRIESVGPDTLKRERHRLFLFEPLLWEVEEDPFIRGMLRFWLWVSWILLPLGTLFYLQIEFLDYQSEAITWTQRGAILLDCFAILALARFSGWAGVLDKLRWFREPVRLAIYCFVPVLLTLVLCVRGGTVDEHWRDNGVSLISHEDGSGLPNRLWKSYRVLDLTGRTLVPRNISSATLSKLVSDNGFARLWADEGLGLSLRNRVLRGAVFVSANLVAAQFGGDETDLSGADFSEVKARFSSFSYARLDSADFSSADIRGANFLGASMFGADLRGSTLTGADLTVTNLQGALLERANMVGVRLLGADLTGANLASANLALTTFSGSDLTGAVLSRASIPGSNFNPEALALAALDRIRTTVDLDDSRRNLRALQEIADQSPYPIYVWDSERGEAELLEFNEFDDFDRQQIEFVATLPDTWIGLIDGLTETNGLYIGDRATSELIQFPEIMIEFSPVNEYPVAWAAETRKVFCGESYELREIFGVARAMARGEGFAWARFQVQLQPALALALAKNIVRNGSCPAFDQMTREDQELLVDFSELAFPGRFEAHANAP